MVLFKIGFLTEAFLRRIEAHFASLARCLKMLEPVCYRKWFLCRVILELWVALVVFRPVAGLRPLRETARSWGDEVGNWVPF